MTKPSETKPNPMAAVMENMAALNPMQVGPFKAMFDASTEAMQFLSSRMEQNLEAQRAIMACKTFENIQTVQANYYTKALEDYRGATAKMMELLKSGTAGGANAAVSSTNRKYDDVPL